jgi:ABC-type lipoprotein release transport system permease subunit
MLITILKILGGLLGLAFLVAIIAILVLLVVTAIDIAYSPKRLLLALAARSITSHRVKSLIVGGLLAIGTVLLVLGLTLQDNTKRQMETSITGGLVGHIQIVSSAAKDDLAFFGFAASSSQDIGNIADFKKVKTSIEKLPNVSAVVPMGRDIATVIGGNEFDDRLGELRKAVEANDQHAIALLVSRLKHMITLLKSDRVNRQAISRAEDELKTQLATIDQALAPQFWEDFKTTPLKTLDFLDTKIAPLLNDEAAFILPYIGTDLDSFARNFPRFQIDTDNHSQMLPSGARGFLFNRTFYEEQAKNKVAHELDEIKRTMQDDKTTIAKDVDLQERVKKNINQYRRITYQLTDEDSALVEAALRKLLPHTQGTIDDLLKELLNVNDQNFNERYKFFYDVIAPHIRLYKVNVGDTVTIRAYTKSGYPRALNLKVYGTFHFQGIDGSPVASRYNFIDLMSFRDLYGLMTPDRQKEIDAIKAQVGVKEVNLDNAEAELFGNDASAKADVQATSAFDDPTQAQTINARKEAAQAAQRRFSQDDIDNGVVLNAAIILKNPAKLAQTMKEIEQLNTDQKLGIKLIDWTTASGIVGQLVGVLMGLLLFVIVIIILTVLIIINNSMVMATMDRTVEIGMMRAIGAQRRFVRAMYMLETAALTVFSAGVGSAISAGIVLLLNRTGLRAPADLIVIMFGGRYLHPTLAPLTFAMTLLIVGVVSLAATFYPALIATRIAPVVAMQRRE